MASRWIKGETAAEARERDAAFRQWMHAVDACISARCGLSHADLADQCWADWFLSGMDPDEAAAAALEEEGFPEDEE